MMSSATWRRAKRVVVPALVVAAFLAGIGVGLLIGQRRTVEGGVRVVYGPNRATERFLQRLDEFRHSSDPEKRAFAAGELIDGYHHDWRLLELGPYILEHEKDEIVRWNAVEGLGMCLWSLDPYEDRIVVESMAYAVCNDESVRIRRRACIALGARAWHRVAVFAPVLPQLRDALTKEKDAVIRKDLERIIERIKRFEKAAD